MCGPITLLDHTVYSTRPKDRERYLKPEQLELLCRFQEQLDRRRQGFLDLSQTQEEWQKPKELKLLEPRGRNAIQTGPYVGAFVFEGTQVTIASRFDGPEQYLLRWLLEHCWSISSLLLDEGLEGTSQWDMYDWFLICRLAMQLQEAWRKGVFRAYRSESFYDSRVRGQLDVPRHLRLNLGQKDGRAAYRTREYTPDNPNNRLLLWAFRAARAHYPQLVRRLLQEYPNCRAALACLERAIPDWTAGQLRDLLKRTRKKIVHPIYRGYEPARCTARALLQRLGQDLQGERSMAGVVLDADKLWEELLAKTLFAGAAETQKEVPILGGSRTIRPDFLLDRAVLDAKYRRVWNGTLEGGRWSKYVREDVFQVLSYMLALDRPAGGVLFPAEQPALVDVRPISRARPDLHFWRLPFCIPAGAGNYQQFRAELQAQADVLRFFLLSL